jgi:hypothetical protein
MVWVTMMLACARPLIVDDVRVAADPDLPGVATVTFSTSAPAAGAVEVRVQGELAHVTPLGPEGTTHAVRVRGLKVGGAVTLAPVATPVDGATVVGPAQTLEVPALRSDAPVLEVEVDVEARQCSPDGYLITSLVTLDGRSWVAIIDRDGDWVWGQPGPFEEWQSRVKVSADGDSLLWLHNDYSRVDDVGRVTRMGIDDGVVTETRMLQAHHDFVEHDDGTLAWLAYELDEQFELDGELLPLATDAIYVAAEGSDTETPAQTFSMLADYPPGIWDTGPEMDRGYFLPGYHEFSHGNSLVYLPWDDAYYVMFRWLDALVKVDRPTGEVLWQWGGRDGDLQGTDAFSHAHFSEAWEGGVLLFDNADNTGRVSGVAEYTIDEEAGTFERTWEYRHPDGAFEFFLGDARRMPDCDNVLVAWSTQRRVEEITRASEVVWALQAPPGWIVSRTLFVDSLYDMGRTQGDSR